MALFQVGLDLDDVDGANLADVSGDLDGEMRVVFLVLELADLVDVSDMAEESGLQLELNLAIEALEFRVAVQPAQEGGGRLGPELSGHGKNYVTFAITGIT